MTALQASQLMDPFRPDRPTLLQARALLCSCLVTRGHARHICANACHACKEEEKEFFIGLWCVGCGRVRTRRVSLSPERVRVPHPDHCSPARALARA